MLRLTFPVLICSCLVACAGTRLDSSKASEPPAAEPAAALVRSSAEIFGRWDIVSFEGYRPGHMHGTTPAAFARFTATGVALRIECNYSGVNGFVHDGRFIPQPGSQIQTEMGCGKEREDRDERYFSFFRRSPTVERLPGGKLRLVAGDSVLMLERPEQRRLDYLPDRAFLQGSWRMRELTEYDPQGGYAGIGLDDLPGRIVIQGDRLSYTACPQYALTFTYSPNGHLLKTGGASLLQQPDCAPLRYPSWAGEAMPSAMLILPLLHSNPWVEKVGDGLLLVANERLGLLLSKEP